MFRLIAFFGAVTLTNVAAGQFLGLERPGPRVGHVHVPGGIGRQSVVDGAVGAGGVILTFE